VSDKAATSSRLDLIRDRVLAAKKANEQEPVPVRPVVRPQMSLYNFTRMRMVHICRHEEFKDRLEILLKLMAEEGYVILRSSAMSVLHQIEREELHVPDQRLTKSNFERHVKGVKVYKGEDLMAFAQKHLTVAALGKFKLEHERITVAARNSRKFEVVSSDAMIASIRTLVLRANRLAIAEDKRTKRTKQGLPS